MSAKGINEEITKELWESDYKGFRSNFEKTFSDISYKKIEPILKKLFGKMSKQGTWDSEKEILLIDPTNKRAVNYENASSNSTKLFDIIYNSGLCNLQPVNERKTKVKSFSSFARNIYWKDGKKQDLYNFINSRFDSNYIKKCFLVIINSGKDAEFVIEWLKRRNIVTLNVPAFGCGNDCPIHRLTDDIKKNISEKSVHFPKQHLDFITAALEEGLIKIEFKNNEFVYSIYQSDSLLTTGRYLIGFSYDHRWVASQSTMQGWRSCMNLDTDINKTSNYTYVGSGTAVGVFIAYLIDKQNASHGNLRPTARILFKPMFEISSWPESEQHKYKGYDTHSHPGPATARNENFNPTFENILWVDDQIYGEAPTWFPKIAKLVVNKAQNFKDKFGTYRLTNDVYQDEFTPSTLHGAPEAIKLAARLIKKNPIQFNSFSEKKKLAIINYDISLLDNENILNDFIKIDIDKINFTHDFTRHLLNKFDKFEDYIINVIIENNKYGHMLAYHINEKLTLDIMKRICEGIKDKKYLFKICEIMLRNFSFKNTEDKEKTGKLCETYFKYDPDNAVYCACRCGGPTIKNPEMLSYITNLSFVTLDEAASYFNGTENAMMLFLNSKFDSSNCPEWIFQIISYMAAVTYTRLDAEPLYTFNTFKKLIDIGIKPVEIYNKCKAVEPDFQNEIIIWNSMEGEVYKEISKIFSPFLNEIIDEKLKNAKSSADIAYGVRSKYENFVTEKAKDEWFSKIGIYKILEVFNRSFKDGIDMLYRLKFFKKDEWFIKNLDSFFANLSIEELEPLDKLISYNLLRGGFPQHHYYTDRPFIDSCILRMLNRWIEKYGEWFIWEKIAQNLVKANINLNPFAALKNTHPWAYVPYSFIVNYRIGEAPIEEEEWNIIIKNKGRYDYLTLLHRGLSFPNINVVLYYDKNKTPTKFADVNDLTKSIVTSGTKEVADKWCKKYVNEAWGNFNAEQKAIEEYK